MASRILGATQQADWADHRFITHELLIGLTVAITVLPQAVAFSTTLAGLPPYFGIYGAIWGVLITALLNPSRTFLGGPNSALSAVMGVTLLPIVPQFGAEYMSYALTLVLMAGLLQMLFFFVRPLTKLFDLMSEAVINGMICGIGVFLIFKSITAFGGLPINTEVEWPLMIAWQSLLAVLEIGNLHAIQIGMLTLAVMVVMSSFRPMRNWAILVGIVAGTAYSEYLNAKYGLENTLIEQTADFSAIGFIFPSLPTFSQEAVPDIIAIIPGAVTIAVLGLLQTVAAIRRMNRKSGQHVNNCQAIAADSVANCSLPFLSSLPTCASFNRMWLVHSMGGKTRLVAASSALFLLLFVMLFSDLIAIIPVPAMAAVIILVGARMINWSDIRPHFSSRSESIIFIAAFFAVHVLGLFGAVVFGSALALIHFKWRKLHPDMSVEDGVMTVHGSLYYGSLPYVERKVKEAAEDHLTLTIDLRRASYIDAEAKRWLAEMEGGGAVEVVHK